jgi:hypothetical protein
MRDAAPFINNYAQIVQLRAERRVSAYVFHDFPYAREQACVVEYRLADSNAVPMELARVAHQTRGMRQRSYRNGSIIRRHAAKLVTRYKHSLRTQIPRAKRRGHAGWPATDY